MFASRLILPVSASFLLGGCGLYVPELEEFPGRPVDGQVMVQAIVTSVHCEVADAVKWVIDQDLKDAKQFHQKPSATWMYNWGAQIALTLTVEEKSVLNPVAVLTPPSPATAVFTLAGAGLLSADATRTDKVNFYYSVADLYKRAPCTTGKQPKNSTANSLLIQSDLKLTQWLQDQVQTVATGEINQPTSASGIFKQNVLSHEVKFEVISTGGITPAWKLTRANFNQTGTLLQATRDRTHDLIITFGPGDSKGLTSVAAIDSHLASLIGLSVANNLRNIPLP